MIKFLPHEPWVHLPSGKELATWTNEDEVAYNQALRHGHKLAFYMNAFDLVVSLGVAGDYYEFGCHRVRTFRMALTEARRHRMSQMRFLAFDSFEGLPEPTSDKKGNTGYVRGALCTSEEAFWEIIREHDIYVDHVRAFKGFYQDSLTPDLQKRLLNEDSRISLVCVDCNLYESAEPVFRFIEPLLQEGSIVYMDDYFAGHKASPHKGPAKAFHEFERRSRFKFAQHMQIGWYGRSFITYLP